MEGQLVGTCRSLDGKCGRKRRRGRVVGKPMYGLERLLSLGAALSVGKSRSEEHTSELQSQSNLVCRLLLEKKNAVQSVVAGEVEEVVVLAEAEPRRALGGAEHHDQPLLDGLRQLLAPRGELGGRLAHALGEGG